MELARSSAYPLAAPNPVVYRLDDESTLNQARKIPLKPEDDSRLVQKRSHAQERILSRNQQSLSVDDEGENSGITKIVIQAPANQSKELPGLPQLEAGLSSSAFLAQQLAQTPEDEFLPSESPVHKSASSAYNDTLNLTTTILGLDGFRERVA